jgi:hypothetical protein
MTWLTGWGLRKSHVINYAAGAGTLYPVKIIVHKAAGSDSGSDVYLGTHVRDDFKDVRFAGSDGATLLDCFMESFTSGSVATFWVEVAEDLTSVNRTIYIYYDKATETTIVSNAIAANIFQLREHKYYTGYNPDVAFSRESSTRTRSASTTASFAKAWMFFVVPRLWLHGKYLRFNWQGAYSGTLGSDPFRVRVHDGLYCRSTAADFPIGTDLDLLIKGNGILQTPDYQTTNFGPVTKDVLMALAGGSQDFVGIFFRLRDPQGNCAYTEDVDWLEINSAAGGSGNLLTVHFTDPVTMEVTGGYGDYGLVRKYVSPEPAHSTWGTEQAPVVAPTVTTEAATGLGLD